MPFIYVVCFICLFIQATKVCVASYRLNTGNIQLAVNNNNKTNTAALLFWNTVTVEFRRPTVSTGASVPTSKRTTFSSLKALKIGLVESTQPVSKAVASNAAEDVADVNSDSRATNRQNSIDWRRQHQTKTNSSASRKREVIETNCWNWKHSTAAFWKWLKSSSCCRI